MARTFQDWYNENKDRLSAERKLEYRRNPVLRQRRQRQALTRYRTLKRRERPIDRRSVVNQEGARFISIGRLSHLISRDVMSIRRYHRQGVIPEPLFHDARGWRLYSMEQAILLRRVFRRFEDREDDGVKNLRDVAALLLASWREGGSDGEEGRAAES